jgi:hypothetical protein
MKDSASLERMSIRPGRPDFLEGRESVEVT